MLRQQKPQPHKSGLSRTVDLDANRSECLLPAQSGHTAARRTCEQDTKAHIIQAPCAEYETPPAALA